MFRWYGLFGILIILLVEINFFFKIQPFANLYFPLVWIGYILVIDALVYKLKGNSLISDRFGQFLGMAFMSLLFWWIFELLNNWIRNWEYNQDVGHGIGAATILPALFETAELIKCIHLFDNNKLKKKHNISKTFLHVMFGIGILSFLLPFFFPKYTYPLVWISFFFLLDPINYIHKQPSVINHFKDRKLLVPLSLLLAGIILGFLWEFWNYWAIPRWTYDIPFVGFFKIFEMPILGYLGYFPFAFELYAMYWFVRSLVVHKEHLLAD